MTDSVTVFGGSGFVGRHIVRRLASDGADVRIAVRHPGRAKFLKDISNRITLIAADVWQERSVGPAIHGSDAVVNTVGHYVERGRATFDAVHGQGALHVARACAEAGIRRLVHISGLGADLPSPSAYVRARAKGERLVSDTLPSATILRPSVIFGPVFIGDDVIKLGIIFKPASVTPVGDPMSADPADNAAFGVFDRPPVAQVFEVGDERFAVVVNHFKSKSCQDAEGGNQDQGDGQGCFNARRVDRAGALLTFIEDIQQQAGVDDVLVLGDFNAYGEEDPLDALRVGRLVDLVGESIPDERRYSFVFDAQSGYLDHAFATPPLVDDVTGITVWHINADEADVLDYRTDSPEGLFAPDPFRSSDHDPILIGLAFGEQPADNLAEYCVPAQGLEGPALRAALHGIIRDHTRRNYDTVWEILQEADEDPDDPTAVIAFYTGRSIPKADRDRGGNTPDARNREHLWASSHGFPNESQHAFTDAHHIRAADKSTNGDRGNRDFDEGGRAHDECSVCVFDGDSWDPGPSRRGDVARALFYMDLRYEGGGEGGTPDLVLVDRTTVGGEPSIGHLCTSLEWHDEDPVDEAERRRNDVIFAWQHNRNPFIDHPEWVAVVYEERCEG